jgi:hypothetical protein
LNLRINFFKKKFMITKANFEKYFIIFIFLGPPLGLGGGGGGVVVWDPLSLGIVLLLVW